MRMLLSLRSKIEFLLENSHRKHEISTIVSRRKAERSPGTLPFAMIRLTMAGEAHVPKVDHHFSAWGGIKECLRINGGAASRDQLVAVLRYCWHNDPKFCPNTAYLDYAIRAGWLEVV